jgi:hypothetical protein
MGEIELLDQLLVSTGLIERVQVLAVQVLDEGLFETHGIISLMDECRDRLESCASRSAVAALAGNEFELFRPDLSHEHRLEDADGLDRVHKGGQALLAELVAGLEWVRPDPG